jgi:hypothetical protein
MDVMAKQYGHISRKELIFFGIYIFMLLLECWPGLFVGNRAEPFILGMPFFLVYQFIAVVVTVGFFVIHYILDHRSGELDYEVDPNYDYMKDKEKYLG